MTNPISTPNAKGMLRETAETLGLSLVLAFGIRTFVAEARYIPSGSMLPTPTGRHRGISATGVTPPKRSLY
jgi:hypothetical protein